MDLFRLVQCEADQALLQAQISMESAISLLSQPRLDLSLSPEPLTAELKAITEKALLAFETTAFVCLKG